MRVKIRAWDKKKREMWTDVLSGLGGSDLYDDHLSMRAVGNMIENGDKSRFDFMLYSGVTDKHGKEICAGDIVRYAAFDIEVITDVYFSDGAFWVRSTLLGEVAQKTDVEIIGDIYQSPELLPFIRELGGSRCYGA